MRPDRSAKEALARRLQWSIEHGPYGLGALAVELGVTRQTLGKYASGRSDPSALLVAEVARLCGVSVRWLVSGEGSPEGTELEGSLVSVPLVDVRLGAGSAGFWDAAGGVVRRIGLPGAWLRSVGVDPALAFLATVLGSSMGPSLSDGDTVLGERADEIDRDGIYAVVVNDEAFIKRVQRVPPRGGVRLRLESDNKAFPEIEVYESDHLDVIGRVVRKVVAA